MTLVRNKLKQIDIWVLIFVIIIGSMLAILSVMRYRGYNASMLDLGNMAQAIWSVTQGRPLEFTYNDGTFSRLALHAEVIYFLLAPLYAVFPSPVTLLIFQAFLFVSAGFPLYRLAYRKLQHNWASRFIVLVYLFYPVAQTAVLFDFHGDTLAMPILIFMLEALDRRRWRSYFFWLVLALCCKFYVSATILGLGIIGFKNGDKVFAWKTIGIALFWGMFTFFIIKPLFGPKDAIPMQATAAGYFATYFGHFRELSRLSNIIPRLSMIILVVGPAIWLGWRGWKWFIPAGTIILPAISTIGVVAAYDYRFHHYAIAVPFLVRGVLEGAEILRQKQRSSKPGNLSGSRRPWFYEVVMQFLIVALFACILVDIPLNPQFWLNKPWWGVDSWAYGNRARDAFVDSWLKDNVSPKVPLMTTGFIAPHVINRRDVYMTLVPTEENVVMLEKRLDEVDVIVVDALYDFSTPVDAGFNQQNGDRNRVVGLSTGHPLPSQGGILYNREIIAYLMASPTFGITEVQDGMMLFSRNEVTDASTIQYKVDLLNASRRSSDYIAVFGGRIALIDYQSHHSGRNRYEFSFLWLALQDLKSDAPYLAVSRLGGIEHARIVHIGTEVLRPTSEWQVGVPIRETFNAFLPDDIPPGEYPLYVGWYDSSHLYAAWTDARSRLGEEVLVSQISIP